MNRMRKSVNVADVTSALANENGDLSPANRQILNHWPTVERCIADYLRQGLEDLEQATDLSALPAHRQSYLALCRDIVRNHAPAAGPIKRIEEIPGFAIEANIIDTVGKNWVKLVLNEKNDVITTLFAPRLLPKFYEGSSPRNANLFDVFGTLLHRDMELCPERPLTVLEIGAGTGGLSKWAIPECAQRKAGVRYIWSDVTPYFLLQAERMFKAYPFVEFVPFNLTVPVAQQAIEQGSVDLVIAYDALHTVPHIYPMLENLRSALTPDGMLLVIEPRRTIMADFIFGLFPEWFGFKDLELRDHVLMDRDQWTKALTDCGYQDVTFAMHEQEEQFIFVTQRG